MTDIDSRVLPSLQAHMRVPGHVLMRQVGDELVLLNLEKERYYGLNPVGLRLMQLAETGATLCDVAEQLLSEFDVGRETLEMDLRTVSADLIAAGLLVEGSTE